MRIELSEVNWMIGRCRICGEKAPVAPVTHGWNIAMITSLMGPNRESMICPDCYQLSAKVESSQCWNLAAQVLDRLVDVGRARALEDIRRTQQESKELVGLMKKEGYIRPQYVRCPHCKLAEYSHCGYSTYV